MGMWGLGVFQNDDAGDWSDQLLRGSNLDPVLSAFSEVIDNEEYLELPESCAGLAAAEVVAALRGNVGADLPNKISVWILSHSISVDDKLVETAKDVVGKIRNDSELQGLVEDTGRLSQWYEILADLNSRLR